MNDHKFALSDSPRQELRSQIIVAFQTHHRWVDRVEDAIVTGSVDEDLTEVVREDACQIGRWLNGGISEELRETALYKVTKGRHAGFHRSLAAVLQLAREDKEDEARLSLSDQGEFGQAAFKMRQTLEQWLKLAE